MKIIVVNNFEALEFEVNCSDRLSLFYHLRNHIENKIINLWIANKDFAFVEFENLDGLNTNTTQDKILEKEIEAYKLYKKAIDFAIYHHGEQKYDKVLPYYFHLKQTDKVVDAFYSDIPLGKFFMTKTGAILHDVLEDTPITYEKLVKEFNEEIADAVLKVTKIDEVDTVEYEENYYRNMSDNEVAVIIKIADKCANSKQTVKNMSEWHAKRLVNGHPIFQNYTYNYVNAPKLKNYLDRLVNKLKKKYN